MTVDSRIRWFLGISIAIIAVIIVGTATLVWVPLSPVDRAALVDLLRENIGYLFMAAILLFAVAAFAFDAFIHLYLIPLRRLIEDIGVICSVNPAHRVQVEGARDIGRLVAQINAMAALVDQSRADAAIAAEKARADIEEEKDILAAIMAELPQGVAICNAQGTILLLNRRFKTMLAPESAEGAAAPPEQFAGLGRSVYSLMDPHMVGHTFEDVREQVRRDVMGSTVSSFVMTNVADRHVRVETAPILNPDRTVTGFVMIMNDITDDLVQDDRVKIMVDTLSRGLRGSLASIRSSIETILHYPDMPADRLDRFRRIIHDESIVLGQFLDKTAFDHASRMNTQWPLVPMHAPAFMAGLTERAAGMGITIAVIPPVEDRVIHIDRYSFVLSVLHLLNRVCGHRAVHRFEARLTSDSHRVHLDFSWKGQPVKIFHVRWWGAEPVSVGGERLGFAVQAVLSHHGVDVWPHMPATAEIAHLRFFLPLEAPARLAAKADMRIHMGPRPEYYDFDLFGQDHADESLDGKPLAELVFTVFDTETTGLDPTGGDEIVSIAAVRIVNGRLLAEDRFDQLVNPGRDIPEASTRIHGIHPADVTDCPTIDAVLPRFARYAENTVLVAHNAAFDMRMLQLKEAQAGVSFSQPVLDTLLLSAVVHPSQRDHFLDAIARRLGISVTDRHTAMGDAVATARIFLNLIPILEAHGIATLAQARAASRKVFFSRMTF